MPTVRELFWSLVESCISRGITSVDKWKAEDLAEFKYYWNSNIKGLRVGDILKTVKVRMASSCTLSDYIYTQGPLGDFRSNKVYSLLLMNGMDPVEVGKVICKWACAEGQYNTIWVTGNNHTGAVSFVEALAGLSPLVGKANFDELNPFDGLRESLVIVCKNAPFKSSPDIMKTVLTGNSALVGDRLNPAFKVEMLRIPVLCLSEDLNDDMSLQLKGSVFHIRLTMPLAMESKCIECYTMSRFLTHCKLQLRM